MQQVLRANDFNKKVLVAGAGIGGLTAAACLLQAGYDVEIYEAASELAEIGAGIQISANAAKVLHHLGLAEELEKVSVRPKALEFRLYSNAELLHEVPLSKRHTEQYGAPYYHIHRADLHTLLMKKVLSLRPNCIFLNARAVGFKELDTQVQLQLADGRMVNGDLLIGADGVRSEIRKQIVGDAQAKFTGYSAWRATIPVERLPVNFMDRVATLWCGPERHVVMYYLCAGKLLNFVGIVESEDWQEESWVSKSSWQELKKDFAGWHRDIQTAIDLIDKNECYRWALNVRETASKWSIARATLLGDSAHATLPFMAQGAAMAIEDAMILTRSLVSCTDIDVALDVYQRNRMARTTKIVQGSAESGQLYHLATAEEFQAGFAKRNMAKELSSWVYSYDPLVAPLV
ncbi:FAD-dependent monooxygenase [Piscirickettsia litoralis]|uniref:FAD-binding domain-containing protein n=1 Tax=Piscirickettsia litoralis TaxID=1891921 RepID=A0ABX2ZZ30_9GAMM|nr:FAD-dependent monooxygenase [Piscirickettsia litoralis]ODN41822.1 hypothetical protein BGC07_01050 [Piscirickettsia litoralis]